MLFINFLLVQLPVPENKKYSMFLPRVLPNFTYLKIVVCLVSQRRIEPGNVAAKLGRHVDAEALPTLRTKKIVLPSWPAAGKLISIFSHSTAFKRPTDPPSSLRTTDRRSSLGPPRRRHPWGAILRQHGEKSSYGIPEEVE